MIPGTDYNQQYILLIVVFVTRQWCFAALVSPASFRKRLCRWRNPKRQISWAGTVPWHIGGSRRRPRGRSLPQLWYADCRARCRLTSSIETLWRATAIRQTTTTTASQLSRSTSTFTPAHRRWRCSGNEFGLCSFVYASANSRLRRHVVFRWSVRPSSIVRPFCSVCLSVCLFVCLSVCLTVCSFSALLIFWHGWRINVHRRTHNKWLQV